MRTMSESPDTAFHLIPVGGGRNNGMAFIEDSEIVLTSFVTCGGSLTNMILISVLC